MRANYGDVNDDGVVNISDFNLLFPLLDLSMQSDPGDYILNADFNADGVIDIADFNILSGNFAASAEPPAGAISKIGNTIGYAGYVWDPALGGNTTGAYLARNRWYSPSLGRWVSRDPIGFAGGDMNLYGYVGGMPGVLTDPEGKFAHIIGGAIVGAVVGAIIAAVDDDVSLAEGVLVGAAAGAVGAATFGAGAALLTGGAGSASALLGASAAEALGGLTIGQAAVCGAAGGLASGVAGGTLSEAADVLLPSSAGADGTFDLGPIGESAAWGLITGPLGGWMSHESVPWAAGAAFEALNQSVRWAWERGNP